MNERGGWVCLRRICSIIIRVDSKFFFILEGLGIMYLGSWVLVKGKCLGFVEIMWMVTYVIFYRELG